MPTSSFSYHWRAMKREESLRAIVRFCKRSGMGTQFHLERGVFSIENTYFRCAIQVLLEVLFDWSPLAHSHQSTVCEWRLDLHRRPFSAHNRRKYVKVLKACTWMGLHSCVYKYNKTIPYCNMVITRMDSALRRMEVLFAWFIAKSRTC